MLLFLSFNPEKIFDTGAPADRVCVLAFVLLEVAENTRDKGESGRVDKACLK